MPKTVSTRIENDLHEELVDRCNALGCRVNDFIKASIEYTLHDSVDFDFGNDDDKVDQSEQKSHTIIRNDPQERNVNSNNTSHDDSMTSKRRHIVIDV